MFGVVMVADSRVVVASLASTFNMNPTEPALHSLFSAYGHENVDMWYRTFSCCTAFSETSKHFPDTHGNTLLCGSLTAVSLSSPKT